MNCEAISGLQEGTHSYTFVHFRRWPSTCRFTGFPGTKLSCRFTRLPDRSENRRLASGQQEIEQYALTEQRIGQRRNCSSAGACATAHIQTLASPGWQSKRGFSQLRAYRRNVYSIGNVQLLCEQPVWLPSQDSCAVESLQPFVPSDLQVWLGQPTADPSARKSTRGRFA